MLKIKNFMCLSFLIFAPLSYSAQYEIDFFLDKNPKFYEIENFVKFLPRFDKIICGHKHCYAIQEGVLYSAGSNKRGQLGIGHFDNKLHSWTKVKNVEKINQVEAWADYGMFVTDSGKIYGVGNANSGMIGLPEKKDYSKLTEVQIDTLYSQNVTLIMSERTTFLHDVENNKYFVTGRGYSKSGAFAMFDRSTRMGFIEVDLKKVSDQIVFPDKKQ